jgi:hypothetical protein
MTREHALAAIKIAAQVAELDFDKFPPDAVKKAVDKIMAGHPVPLFIQVKMC